MSEEKIIALGRCEVFAELSRPTLELIAEVARPRELAGGQHLFRRGDLRDALFVVVSGQLEVLVGEADSEGAVFVLGPGEGVAEAALIEASLHAASARALGPLEVLELDVATLRRRLVEDGAAGWEVLSQVARVVLRRLQFSAVRRGGWDLVYRGGATRTEHDLLGDREVPVDASYGVQTLRAVENFPITGIRLAHFPHADPGAGHGQAGGGARQPFASACSRSRSPPPSTGPVRRSSTGTGTATSWSTWSRAGPAPRPT